MLPSLCIDCYWCWLRLLCYIYLQLYSVTSRKSRLTKYFRILNYAFHDKEDHNLKKCSHQPQYLRQSNDILTFLTTQWSDSLHWSQSNDDDNCDHEMIREPQETVCYRRPDGDPGDPRDPVHGPARPVPRVSVTLSRSECKKSDGKLRFNWQKVVCKNSIQSVVVFKRLQNRNPRGNIC